MTDEVEQLGINVIRGLAMDAPQKAGNGHPGTAMALAPLAHVLFTRVMQHDPAEPDWPDRDRFVLSGGHASILLYSMLYLTGYGLDARRHQGLPPVRVATRRATPRCTTPPGVEVTTGPLGQGFANGVGMGDRRELAARPVRPRARRPPHVRDLQRRRPHGGHQPRGRVAGRPPRARPPRLRLRRQPHHDRRAAPSWPSPTTPPRASRPTAGTSTSSARSPTTSTRSKPRSAARWPSRTSPSLLVLRSHIGWPAPTSTDTA